MKLIISRAAAADLDRLRAFLAGKNPAAAQRAITILIKAIESLNTLPERPAIRNSEHPRTDCPIRPICLCATLRYAYSPETGDVVVIRIWHGRELRE
jgi:toxin ParE1/3/4